MRGLEPHHAPFVRSTLGLFTFQNIGTVREGVGFFTCMPVPNGTVNLRYPAVDCSSVEYKALIAPSAIMLLATTVMVPAGLFRLLSRAKRESHLLDPDFKAKFGLLYEHIKVG